MSLDGLREAATKAAPDVVQFVFGTLCRVESYDQSQKQKKPVNDPVWKTVWLEPCEVALLDSSSFQRLRRVRQLGLAYLVYPGAQHTRFEHSIGAVEAASRMFDRLATGTIKPEQLGDLRKTVRLAALMHDCGHTAFSHLGENILEGALSTPFQLLSDALAEFLKKRVGGESDLKHKPKSSRPAEVMSALILGAPETEKLLRAYAITENQILDAISLVLGFSIGKKDSYTHYSFLDFIVSGDLDVDKIDYVARDAYFAGIPISSDVDRLINQLTPALREEKDERRYMFGIRHSGVSPVEMFVMTRAYLFDRLYRHPKIRAVEKFIERGITSYLSGKPTADILGALYTAAGDDGCLALLSDNCKAASCLLARDVPIRALAIGPRLMIGFDEATQSPSERLSAAWLIAQDELKDDPDSFSSEVIELAGACDDGHMFFYDAPPRGTLSENPDIWVTEPESDRSARRINSMFDTERFSNAYHDRHAVNWMFASKRDKLRIAAASALVFAERYGIVVSTNAGREAKIPRQEFTAGVDAVYKQTSPQLQQRYEEAHSLLSSSSGNTLVFSTRWIEDICPAQWNDLERREFALKFKSLFTKLNLPNTFSGELDNCLKVVEAILSHAYATLEHQKSTNSFSSEDAFQEDVFKYLTLPAQRQNWQVDTGRRQSHGILDISFAGTKGRGTVPVELKSEKITFDKLVEKHAGQAREYSSAAGFSHFSLLYVESLETIANKPSDLFDVRIGDASTSSKMTTICLALPRREASASHFGKASGPVA